MRHRIRPTIGALGLLAALHVAAAAAIGAPPPSLNPLTTISRSPSTAEKDQIARYVRFWTDALRDREAERANDARRKLIEPLNAPGVSVVFRDAYSDAVVPHAETALEAEDAYLAATVSMQVLGEIATDESLRAITEHLARDDEARVAVRLSAAKAFNRAMERGPDVGSISANRIAGAVRALGRAARDEDDPRVLRWQLQALAALDRTEARDELFKAQARAIERARDAGSAAEGARIVDAVRPSVVTLRNRFLDPNLPRATQVALGRAIAPVLAGLLEVPLAHWDALRDDAGLRTVAEGTIRSAEQLLQFVDSNLQGTIGRTTLDGAFGRGDREGYDAQMQQIRAALDRPPFR